MTPLPLASAEALLHSQRLQAYLQQKMQHHALPFEAYMQDVLYAPGLGYYSAGSHKIGAVGDFTTAPQVSALFGQTIAQAIAPYFANHPHASLLELGPGSGQLALDIALALAAVDAFPAQYYLLEVSADLRQRQRALLQQHLPEAYVQRCVWLETLPTAVEGIILANEVLDALAVHVFKITDRGPQEAAVSIDPQGQWQTTFIEPRQPYLAQRLAALQQRYDLALGYQSELNLRQEALLTSLNDCLQQGLMVFIDYGFDGATYYHPDRHQGTLCCHYRHHVHDDPYYLPGLQDITAHVDFTALATHALHLGLSLGWYGSQAEFLLAHGILTLAQTATDRALQLKHSQALQTLLMPHEMGELFKVMVFCKNRSNPFESIAHLDKRHTL